MPMPRLPTPVMPAKPMAVPMAEIVRCKVMAEMVVAQSVMKVVMSAVS